MTVWHCYRDPWSLQLHRLQHGRLEPAGHIMPGSGDAMASGVIPLFFRPLSGIRPQIEVSHRDIPEKWLL